MTCCSKLFKDNAAICRDSTSQIIINPVSQCENGLAGNYPCKDYDLLAFIPISEMGSLGIEGNDCWGWTDPGTNKEYALMGTTQGVTFIDISDPANAFIVGTLPTHTVNSDWRDVKVHKSIAYIVSEAADHGMQIFNLRRLAGVTNPPVEFSADRHYNKFIYGNCLVIRIFCSFKCIRKKSRINAVICEN